MRSREQGQATPSVVVVGSVAAIVVAMVAFLAGGNDTVTQPQQDAAATTQASRSTPTESATPAGERSEPEQTAAPRTAARTPAREKADARAERRGEQKQKAKDKQRRRQRPEPQTGPPDVYVEVYNNTGVSGLAASTAAELQDAGWQVVGVDNWYGDIPATTVYYPGGFEEAADQLAETLGVDRVRGAVAPMRFDRLTVILSGDG